MGQTKTAPNPVDCCLGLLSFALWTLDVTSKKINLSLKTELSSACTVFIQGKQTAFVM
jgi:hypothetical protein